MRPPAGLLLAAALAAAPAAAVDPGFDPARGTVGTPVLLTGHGFLPARAPKVEFVPDPPPAEGKVRRRKGRVLSFGPAGITVETPRIAPGTYGILVTPKRGEAPGPVPLEGTFTVIPPEVHSTDQETYGPGATGVLTGVFGSRKGGRVDIGGFRARVLSWTDGEIRFTVPDLPPGSHPILVRNRTGVSQATHSVVVAGAEEPVPAVTLSTTLLEVQVPQNCHRYFQITNTGEPGSQLSYTVADNGALGGFLELQNASGTLAQGQSVDVGVRVLPQFAGGEEAPAGADLVLNVLTPGASNFTSIPVSVKVRSAAAVAQRALGTWSGTWSGHCLGPNNPMQEKPAAAVSGTWTVVLTAIDLANETATGSITWNGTDAYWTYAFTQNGYENVQSVAFVPDRTVNFSGTQARFWIPGPQCGRFRLEIRGTQGAFNPSDAYYGPDATLDIDLDTDTVPGAGSTFTTHPYNPSNGETWASNGNLSGSKQ